MKDTLLGFFVGVALSAVVAVLLRGRSRPHRLGFIPADFASTFEKNLQLHERLGYYSIMPALVEHLENNIRSGINAEKVNVGTQTLQKADELLTVWVFDKEVPRECIVRLVKSFTNP